MRRRVVLVAGLWCLLLAVVGCARETTTAEDGYAVLFGGIPQVYDKGVYFNGESVGTIESTQASAANVTKMVVSLAPEFVQTMGNNMAFYVNAGRLEAAPLQNIGQAYVKGEPLCGFHSKADLNWFKFKTLMLDRTLAARELALGLQARFDLK